MLFIPFDIRQNNRASYRNKITYSILYKTFNKTLSKNPTALVLSLKARALTQKFYQLLLLCSVKNDVSLNAVHIPIQTFISF